MIKKNKTRFNTPYYRLIKFWSIILAFLIGIFGFTNCGPVEYGAPPAEYSEKKENSIQSKNIKNNNPIIISTLEEKNNSKTDKKTEADAE